MDTKPRPTETCVMAPSTLDPSSQHPEADFAGRELFRQLLLRIGPDRMRRILES
jgi:hypothetical protein